jgi:hypothetical protein
MNEKPGKMRHRDALDLREKQASQIGIRSVAGLGTERGQPQMGCVDVCTLYTERGL